MHTDTPDCHGHNTTDAQYRGTQINSEGVSSNDSCKTQVQVQSQIGIQHVLDIKAKKSQVLIKIINHCDYYAGKKDITPEECLLNW